MTLTNLNAREISTVVDNRAFLECPRWHEDRLWVSDLYAHEVLSIGQSGDVRVEALVPNRPSGLGWLPDGRLLIVSMLDRKILRREHSGELVVHADLSSLSPTKINDMVVDGNGRAWVGSFGFEFRSASAVEPADLIRIDPNGTASVAATGLHFPNGTVVTPEGVLVVAESMGNRLTAFDIENNGDLTGRRVWAAFGDDVPTSSVADAMAASSVAPDGICLDAEGAIWVADALNRRLVRVRETAGVVDEIQFDTGVFACMLGGADGRTLYACAAPSSSEHKRAHTRDASMLAVHVEVPHAGKP
ncbi:MULTISPECIES: SMP-30/gluconolactonase/LRE family protein [Rhodococcus]|uniref:SMP-30/gluconolactonase/LRE family protein n=1 Tax=Rhodococcus globerulus TaxID=33008 RepID=UPI001C578DA9|nr:SMP-30/gluconolactonase/LRE family protein [Rhodococcus globerulus]QXV99926.1 SMP-30/gluconolactonase/LRE family protein [Rhodococcus globerulus]